MEKQTFPVFIKWLGIALALGGLIAFIVLMFSIWRMFWNGRKQWAVRVAGAYLLSILFFAATGGFLVFSTMQLRSGFAWIILGIGGGASLRKHSLTLRDQIHR